MLDDSFYTSFFQVLMNSVGGEGLFGGINQCLGHLHCIVHRAYLTTLSGKWLSWEGAGLLIGLQGGDSAALSLCA